MKRWLSVQIFILALLSGFAAAQTLSKPNAWGGQIVPRMTVFAMTDVWQGPDGQTLPFEDEDDILRFLDSADVVSEEPLPQGINKFKRVLLKQDGLRSYAVFRDVHVRKDRAKLSNGTEVRNFRDECAFEVAAYRLARLLGLRNVPPAVMRKMGGRRGSLQIWVEQAHTEGHRIENSVSPPDDRMWLNQWQVIRLFDNLIFNDDRNPGNVLIDRNWKLWMIDHTRAFREDKNLLNANLVVRCERGVWQRLQELNQKILSDALDGLLEKRQIRALLTRRDLLVEQIRSRLDQRGEDEVLF